MNFHYLDAARCVRRLKRVVLLLAAVFFGLLPCAVYAAFQDPLDVPAAAVDRLDQRSMQAVGMAGKRLVAVGARGLIAVSEDGGLTWSQSASPVQSDLVAVHFPTGNMGWAVGHEGVILHSKDGGKTWEKQLDGRLAKDLFVRYYKPGAEAGNVAHKTALDAVERNYKSGPTLPLLDVWFDDERNGFAVGAFGLIISTADGGRTWTPWLDRIDNPETLHLNAIRGGGGDVYIAAERGMVFRLDRAARRFNAIATGYTGSFFGLAVSRNVMLAYGLKGAVYRSANRGQTWEAVTVAFHTTISGGAVLDATGQFVLVDIAGGILTGDASGLQFSVKKSNKGWRYTGVVPLAGERVMLTALEGIQVESWK
jgi:photosystem II stability/assembly factor-like uncharacterized protein